MLSLRIVLDPERDGLGLGVSDPREVLHLADDAEIVISGLPDGMQSGKPSMMFGFALPDGRVVIAETSWWLFATAFQAFAARFGAEPDSAGKAIEYDATGAGAKVHLDLQADDLPNTFQCELCGEQREEPPGQEGTTAILQFIHRHFREAHPDWPVPA